MHAYPTLCIVHHRSEEEDPSCLTKSSPNLDFKKSSSYFEKIDKTETKDETYKTKF